MFPNGRVRHCRCGQDTTSSGRRAKGTLAWTRTLRWRSTSNACKRQHYCYLFPPVNIDVTKRCVGKQFKGALTCNAHFLHNGLGTRGRCCVSISNGETKKWRAWKSVLPVRKTSGRRQWISEVPQALCLVSNLLVLFLSEPSVTLDIGWMNEWMNERINSSKHNRAFVVIFSQLFSSFLHRKLPAQD